MTRYAALLALLLPGLALAGWKSNESSAPVSSDKGDFSILFPAGWLYETTAHAATASHDGIGLEMISIGITPYRKAFKAAKKQADAHTSAEDLADDFIADRQAAPNALREFAVIDTEPATLAGKPAFRLHYRFRAPEEAGGALIEAVALGAALDGGLLLVMFQAPQIHYFGRWIDGFDEAVKSITLAAPKK